jgi:hypothetical protein
MYNNIGYRHNKYGMIHTTDDHRGRLCSNTWQIITSHRSCATIMSIVLVSALLLLHIIAMSNQVAVAKQLLKSGQQPISSHHKFSVIRTLTGLSLIIPSSSTGLSLAQQIVPFIENPHGR